MFKGLLESWLEKKPSLFWWSILNGAILCLALASWLFFPAVFSYPEKPRNYAILKLLGQEPRVENFTPDSAPDGKTLDPEQLYQTFTSSSLNESNFAELNQNLLRNYLQNYRFDQINYYIRGTFQVEEARLLSSDDLFSEGIVLRLRAMRRISSENGLVPYLVQLDYILPHAAAKLLDSFPTGKVIELNKISHHSALLHIRQKKALDDEPMVAATAIPLCTAKELRFNTDLIVQIKTPKRLSIVKSLPIFP